MVKAKLNVGFVATLSGRWPRERPQKLQTLYGDWAERELTGVNVVRYPQIVTNTDEAAACAVWLHGAAADRCAERLGQYGMLPHDILTDLGALFAENCR